MFVTLLSLREFSLAFQFARNANQLLAQIRNRSHLRQIATALGKRPQANRFRSRRQNRRFFVHRTLRKPATGPSRKDRTPTPYLTRNEGSPYCRPCPSSRVSDAPLPREPAASIPKRLRKSLPFVNGGGRNAVLQDHALGSLVSKARRTWSCHRLLMQRYLRA